MRSLSTLALLAHALSAAYAAPTPEPATDKINSLSYPFHLKTQQLNGGSTRFTDLWVQLKHTDAGGNLAVLQKGTDNLVPQYLNDTRVTFKTKAPAAVSTYYLGLKYANYYDAWGTVSIDLTDLGTKNFKIVNTTADSPGKLVYDNDSFGGWKVCEWTLGQPQLFHNVKFGYKVGTTSNCNNVNLVAV